MIATKTLDNAHGNVSGARILDNAAATHSSSSHPVYPTTAAIERFASPKTEQEITVFIPQGRKLYQSTR